MQKSFLAESQAAQATPSSTPSLKLRKKGHGKTPLVKGADAPAPSDPLPLGELRLVPLPEIVVEDRTRKALGDIKGLARSIAETGLAQPPLVDAQMRLVCGYRRYKAAESLGWTEMPVRVLDIEDPLALMVAEDANRKDLTSSEKFAVCETLRARAQEDRWRKRAFGGRLEAAKEKGRLDEEIGKALRLSRESLRKIRAVHQAAQDDATHYADLVAKLDEDGRVDRHYRELERRRARGDAATAATVVVRPGWEALLERYDARDVPRFVRASLLAAGAEEGTVLLMPSSLKSLHDAASLLRQCGFEWRTTLRGAGAGDEELWLVAAGGRKAMIAERAIALLAEGCAGGGASLAQAAERAFGGAARELALLPEEAAR